MSLQSNVQERTLNSGTGTVGGTDVGKSIDREVRGKSSSHTIDDKEHD
jgi:hypothetical protein